MSIALKGMQEYKIRFKVTRLIREYDDDYFKVFAAMIYEFTPLNSSNKFPLNGSEVISANVPTLIQGNTYSGVVRVRRDEEYGINLHMQDGVTLEIPEDKNEYRDFIQKSFQGVGKTYSKRLVDLFGQDVIENVLENPRALDLAQIPRINHESIRNTADKLMGVNRLISFFQEFNIPLSVARKVHQKQGNSSREQIQNNPWSITSIDYSYFRYADRIGAALGIESNNEERVRSAILAYLKHRMNEGHMAIYASELEGEMFFEWLRRVGEFEETENETILKKDIEKEISELKDNWVLETPTNNNNQKMIYFRNTLQIENEIIEGLNEFINGNRLPITSSLEVPSFLTALKNGDFLTNEEKELGIEPFEPATEQKQAIEMALTHPFSILTGGPGTGKTTVVNSIVQAIEYLVPGASIAMLAPTGKASKRMAEITKRPAMTIHRKLNMHETDDDDLVEIEEDFVIVDESSMVDAYVFSTLINNVSPQTRVLLVGDVDQLPSVGSGAILRDLIESNVIPTTRLLQVFRQAEESPIVSNSYKLNRGETTENMVFENGSQMMLKPLKNDHLMQDSIIHAIQQVVRKRPISEIAVLSPMRKGVLGVNELNRRIQKTVNPNDNRKKEEITLSKKLELVLREGDRVMQTTNDSERGISNGETGVVDAIYSDIVEKEDGGQKETTCIDVVFEDSYVGEQIITYTISEAREQLELAYAMTIHKSQGSEYSTIIIPFTSDHQYMLKRNLIYTAWTRAKELVINIGEEKWINYAAKHNDNVYRISQIREKLEKIK